MYVDVAANDLILIVCITVSMWHILAYQSGLVDSGFGTAKSSDRICQRLVEIVQVLDFHFLPYNIELCWIAVLSTKAML